MDAEALKFALERLSQVLPELPVRLQTLLREEESLKTAIDAFLSDLETKQAEAGDLLSRLELTLQELRQESREGMTLLEGHGDLAVVLLDPSLSFEDRLSDASTEMGRRQLRLATGRVSALGDEREARAGLLDAVFATVSARLGSAGEQVTGAAEAGMLQAADVVTSAETARGALAESVEALGHEIETQRAAGVRDLEELRRDLDQLEAAFNQRGERVETALRQDLARLAEDVGQRISELRQALDKAAAGVTEALHDLDQELEEDNLESQGARKDLVPVFEDLEQRIVSLKHAIESVRDAANLVGIPF